MLRKTTMLRSLLYSPEMTVIMGAYDGLTARIAEQSGFPALWAGGLSISAAHAVPDSGILTMTDFLRQAAVMNLATAIPILADCDTGFGDANNVMNAIRHYEASGIAGVCIEDKALPKRNSFSREEQHLVSTEDFCDKIDGAKLVQRDPDFVVVARVEALIVGAGMKTALHRAKAYAEAGADAILIHSRFPGPQEVAHFAQCWTEAAPLIVIPTTFPEVSTTELQALGFSACIYANQLIRALVRAAEEACQLVRACASARCLESSIVPVAELLALQNKGYPYEVCRLKSRTKRSHSPADPHTLEEQIQSFSLMTRQGMGVPGGDSRE